MRYTAPKAKQKLPMRVFVYEYMTATGTGRDPASPDHAMYREGRAMRDALAEDLRCIDDVEVRTLPDDRAPCDEDQFLKEVERSDQQIVIAPELGRRLHGLTILARTTGKPLGSSTDAMDISSDKLALSERWRLQGVRTPTTSGREPHANERYPLILKPQYGAGSTATFRLDWAPDYFRALTEISEGEDVGSMILQEFVPGRPASVAFLCGPHERVPLLPTFQLLSDDGRFKYEGGELPIPPGLAERAVELGRAAVGCVPGLFGYVGVDLVLGEAGDGSRDYAIEINPRLTTSYIGLRALADFNIAEAMLRIVCGRDVGALRWKPGRVRFDAGGGVKVV